MKNRADAKNGFTLIEVLVSVSIIAIIVAATYSGLTSAKAKGRDAKRASDAVQIRTALTSYSLDHGGVPAASASAGCLGTPDGSTGPTWVCGTSASIATVLQPLVDGKYISSIPTDPINSGGLTYYYSTEAGTLDARTGIYLAPNGSFSYVIESQTANSSSPVVSGTNSGSPDYAAYPGTGYPAGGGVSYSLSVALAGTGSGSVSSSPTGISCGSTCSATIAGGASVTLTASAVSYSTFDGWTGSCSGYGSCALTMTAAQSTTATFNPSWSYEYGQNTLSAGLIACANWGNTNGGTGWHLPSQSEINSAMVAQAYNHIVFPNNFIVSRTYWTSSFISGTQYWTATISSGGGVGGTGLASTSNAYIKCVH